MARRGAFLTALLLSATLAGCAQDVAPAAVSSTPAVILVTDENDLESLSNESFMMAAHQHDYWGGKDRLTVLDVKRDASVTWFGGTWGFTLGPEDGVVVPHGTSRVDVTVTWTDPQMALYADPELWVKTAADHQTQLIGALKSGQTISIETDEADADLPHQSISAWRFEWRIDPPAGLPRGIIRDGGELAIRAEAVRGREIPVYPPHPDLWDGAESMPLFEHARPRGLWNGEVDRDGLGWSCFSACPVIHRPANGTVVPYDAAVVEVILDAAPDPGFDFGLKFHGADTRDWTDLKPARVEGSKRFYHIPLEPGLGDSPYASQSVWGFAIFSEKPERGGWFSGSYAITARALREAPPT